MGRSAFGAVPIPEQHRLCKDARRYILEKEGK